MPESGSTLCPAEYLGLGIPPPVHLNLSWAFPGIPSNTWRACLGNSWPCVPIVHNCNSVSLPLGSVQRPFSWGAAPHLGSAVEVAHLTTGMAMLPTCSPLIHPLQSFSHFFPKSWSQTTNSWSVSVPTTKCAFREAIITNFKHTEKDQKTSNHALGVTTKLVITRCDRIYTIGVGQCNTHVKGPVPHTLTICSFLVLPLHSLSSG